MKLRLMKKKDLYAILDLYGKIYSDWINEGANRKITVPHSALKTLDAYLETDPCGCFVLEEEKSLGFAFSHQWGSIGWLGPLGILKGKRGKGLGKKLTERCVKYLASSGCATIGLETAGPENIGLYLKCGFSPILPRVRLFKPIEKKNMPSDVKPLADLSDTRMIASMRNICSSSERGLDFVDEIVTCEKYGAGRTLLLKQGGRLAGYAFLQTLPSREEKRPLALIKMLAIHPRCTEKKNLFHLLDACEAWAKKEGRKEISIKAYSGYRLLIDDLLEYGYDVQSTTLRMVLQGRYEVDEKIYCGYAWSS